MKRRLFTILSALSLLMCFWSVLAWIADASTPDYLEVWSAGAPQYIEKNGMLLELRAPWYPPVPAEVAPSPVRALGFVYAEGGAGPSGIGHRIIVVPYWVFLIVTTAMPLLWLNSHRRDRVSLRRQKGNFCSRCGYDLRATPERCPECGMVKGDEHDRT